MTDVTPLMLIDGKPFGGYKASGIGRQNGMEGLEGLEQYLETKALGMPADYQVGGR
jgi:aldehyde dehydrogenase (NAD+)